VLGLLAVAATGCGASAPRTAAATVTPDQNTPGHALWSGLGASLPAWEAVHPVGRSECSSGCYGARVRTASGAGIYEFTRTQVSGPPAARITGYTQSLGAEMSVASAERAVLRLLPPDTRTLRRRLERSGGSCVVWILRSATLGRWFAGNRHVNDPRGLVRVYVHTGKANVATETGVGTGAVAEVRVGDGGGRACLTTGR
jgi:hypothetical protein